MRDRPAATASFYGHYTYARHLRAAALDAVATGALLLNEFVARKALGASDYGITLLLMLPTLAQFLNLYWTGQGGANPRRVFLYIGIPARLALVAMAAVGGSISFIVLAALASTATTLLVPAQNALYQANYPVSERGRLYSRVTALAALVTVAVATFLGWLYDRSEGSFRIAYPVAGILAAAGALSWYRIHWRWRGSGAGIAYSPPAIAGVPRPLSHVVTARNAGARLARGIFDPFRATARLFAEDRDFLRFEVAFMTYGLAYMMIQPVLPLYLVDELGVDYSQASNAKGLLFYGVMILCLPVAGRLNDRLGSLRVATLSFLLLSLFPALLWLSRGIGLVYVAYGFFGAAMAGVSVAWTLGPLTLAGERSAERYMGAHVSLVAVRGLIGYPLGLALMRLSAARLTFAVSMALALAAAGVMASLERRRGRSSGA